MSLADGKAARVELPRGPLDGDLVQYEIALPHEYEWETAARWSPDGIATRVYPWGPDFEAAKKPI
ncbi:MAG: hypothetical protein Fur0021_26030 [Candidatus Promineifilaceae bacterium]